MIFKRNEHKHRLSGLYLVVGTLALIGAVGITAKGKKCLCSVKQKMRDWILPTEGASEV